MDIEKVGRPPTAAAFDMVDMRTRREERIERHAKMKKRLPAGQMSRSLYILTTDKHLIRRIRPIEEKRLQNHEFRISVQTKENRGLCDWCGFALYDNPLHFF